MKPEFSAIIDRAFGFSGDLIDAALLSPQHRKRVYWCGKLNPDGTYSKVSVPQPEDAGMKLADILEDIPFDAVKPNGNPWWKPVPEKYIPLIREREKAYAITASYGKIGIENHFKYDRTAVMKLANRNPSGRGMNGNAYLPEYLWRPLTVREAARCQGIPDSYEFVTSDSRSYKGIGNGWEGRTVKHVLTHILDS